MRLALCLWLCAAGCGNNGATCASTVKLDSDPLNCGTCGHKCSAPGGATATCTAGVCGLTCASGTADCDGNAANGCEVMTASDANNCGACNHVCGGAVACSSGMCTPTDLQHNMGTTYALAVDDNNLYFAQYSPTAGRVRVASKAPNSTVTIVADGELGPVDVAVDGSTVYFATYDGGSIKKVPADASAAATTLFQKAQHFPQRMIISGGKIYWCAWDGTVNSMAEDGSGKITIAGSQGKPFGLALDGANLIWITEMMSQVRSAPADMAGATPMLLAAIDKGGDSLVLDGDGIYVTTNNDGRLLKVAKSGMGDPQVLDSGGHTSRIVLDHGLLYYRVDNQIVRMTTAGKDRVVLANAGQVASNDGGLAVDATDVYFADDMGIIRRVAK
jgi:hypothetical protein